jgi:hypothetical protein
VVIALWKVSALPGNDVVPTLRVACAAWSAPWGVVRGRRCTRARAGHLGTALRRSTNRGSEGPRPALRGHFARRAHGVAAIPVSERAQGTSDIRANDLGH